MDSLLRDIKYAFRILIKTPGFTVASILTLAFGLGANIAIFSVVYGVLLKPLPYRDADRLLLVHAEIDYAGAHRPVPVLVDSNEMEAWQQPFEAIASPAFYTNDVRALSGALFDARRSVRRRTAAPTRRRRIAERGDQ